MPEASLILPGFNPIFSAAVALNFSYAASKQLQEALKAGFMRSSRDLSDEAHEKCTQTKDKLNILSEDSFINGQLKENIERSTQTNLDDLKKRMNLLESDLDKYQNLVAKQINPIYIFTGITALFFLILSGQEAHHGIFPREIIMTILTLVMVAFSVFYYRFIKRKQSNFAAPTAGFVALILMTISIFSPNILGIIPSDFFHNITIPIDNKWLANMMIILSFAPFLLSIFALAFINMIVLKKHESGIDDVSKKIDETLSQLDQASKIEDYFKGLT